MASLDRFPSTLAQAVLAAFLGLCIASCGTFTLGDDSPTPNRSVKRRVYVNDKAPNDSLRSDLILRGVKFVLQPNRSYEFALDSTARTGDKLKLFYFKDNVPDLYKTLDAASNGTREVFSFVSDRAAAQFFMVQLSTPDGAQAISSLRHVSLANASALSSDTLQVRLMFIRNLRNFPDSASKAAFAKSLFTEMAKIYSPLGIVLQGSIDIIEPLAPALTFPFSNTYVPLPGNRAPNHAHLYIVDSISIGDPASGLVGEVLGFAPREVVDIDNHPESRVLLSGRIKDPVSLAITATHELGHFFGLRHTVSTKHDFLQDADFSNVEDGFTDTRFCQLDIAFAKQAAPVWLEPADTKYCLRIADNSCSNLQCDLTNLMHPVDCGSRNQIRLSPQQITFLKTNLASYKH
ncbi:MAG: putative lipoprotein [Fibrobacteres bacterium]|nr:putative lipoprotein [Fibrobacterota bacterium]